MTIASILTGIFSTTKAVYDFIEKLKDNYEQSAELLLAIKNIIDVVRLLEKQYSQVPPAHYAPEIARFLEELNDELDLSRVLVIEFTEADLPNKILTTYEHNQRFIALKEKLHKSVCLLNAFLSAQIWIDLTEIRQEQTDEFAKLRANTERMSQLLEDMKQILKKHTTLLESLKSLEDLIRSLTLSSTPLSKSELKALKQERKQQIINAYKNKEITELFGKNHLSLEHQYINLRMLYKHPIHKIGDKKDHPQSHPVPRDTDHEDSPDHKMPIDIEQLFLPAKNLLGEGRKSSEDIDKSPKLVVIQGRAGIGKTTFVHRLASEWANGRLFSQFTWLFVLPLRDVGKYSLSSYTLCDWIYATYFTSSSAPINFERLWEKKIHPDLVQGKVLIVLDGLDEAPSKHHFQEAMEHLLRGGSAPVLITSRPHGISSLSQHTPRHIELLGFVDKNIEDYVTHYFKDSEAEKAPVILEVLRKNSALCKNAHIPVVLNIICWLWKDNSQSMTNKVSTYSSLTELYEAIEIKLLQRAYLVNNQAEWKEKFSPSSPRREKNFLKYFYRRHLTVMMRLAFKNFAPVITIDNLDAAIEEAGALPKSSDLNLAMSQFIKELLALGLIKPILSKGITEPDSYEFLHFTLHEYYAACYLTNLTELKIEKQKEEFTEEFKKELAAIKFNPSYQQVLWFAAGILRNKPELFKKFIDLLQEIKPDAIGNVQLGLLIRCTDEAYALCDKQKILGKFQEQAQARISQLWRSWEMGLYTADATNTSPHTFISALRMSQNWLNSPGWDALGRVAFDLTRRESRDSFTTFLGWLLLPNNRSFDLLFQIQQMEKGSPSVITTIGQFGSSVTPTLLECLIDNTIKCGVDHDSENFTEYCFYIINQLRLSIPPKQIPFLLESLVNALGGYILYLSRKNEQQLSSYPERFSLVLDNKNNPLWISITDPYDSDDENEPEIKIPVPTALVNHVNQHITKHLENSSINEYIFFPKNDPIINLINGITLYLSRENEPVPSLNATRFALVLDNKNNPLWILVTDPYDSDGKDRPGIKIPIPDNLMNHVHQHITKHLENSSINEYIFLPKNDPIINLISPIKSKTNFFRIELGYLGGKEKTATLESIALFGELAATKPILDFLLDMLENPTLYGRGEAHNQLAKTIGQLGKISLFKEYVFRRLMQFQEPGSRSWFSFYSPLISASALKAIVHMEDFTNDNIITLVIELLKSSNEKVQEIAIKTIGSLGKFAVNSDVISTLPNLLQNDGLLEVSLKAIGQLGELAATRPVLKRLLELFDQNKHPMEVIETIIQLGKAELIPNLIEHILILKKHSYMSEYRIFRLVQKAIKNQTVHESSIKSIPILLAHNDVYLALLLLGGLSTTIADRSDVLEFLANLLSLDQQQDIFELTIETIAKLNIATKSKLLEKSMELLVTHKTASYYKYLSTFIHAQSRGLLEPALQQQRLFEEKPILYIRYLLLWAEVSGNTSMTLIEQEPPVLSGWMDKQRFDITITPEQAEYFKHHASSWLKNLRDGNFDELWVPFIPTPIARNNPSPPPQAVQELYLPSRPPQFSYDELDQKFREGLGEPKEHTERKPKYIKKLKNHFNQRCKDNVLLILHQEVYNFLQEFLADNNMNFLRISNSGETNKFTNSFIHIIKYFFLNFNVIPTIPDPTKTIGAYINERLQALQTGSYKYIKKQQDNSYMLNWVKPFLKNPYEDEQSQGVEETADESIMQLKLKLDPKKSQLIVSQT